MQGLCAASHSQFGFDFSQVLATAQREQAANPYTTNSSHAVLSACGIHYNAAPGSALGPYSQQSAFQVLSPAGDNVRQTSLLYLPVLLLSPQLMLGMVHPTTLRSGDHSSQQKYWHEQYHKSRAQYAPSTCSGASQMCAC